MGVALQVFTRTSCMSAGELMFMVRIRVVRANAFRGDFVQRILPLMQLIVPSRQQ